MMKMLTKLITGLAAVLLCGSVMADTFYLNADLPLNPDPDANHYSWWYDAAVG